VPARRALVRALRAGIVVAALVCFSGAAVAATPPWVKGRRIENVARLGEIVTKIHFVGNETFGSDELLLYMETQESTLFGIRHFNEKTLDRDLENLERYYMSQGFFEAEVAVEDLALSEDGLEIEILIGVFEGGRWSVSAITFEGNEKISDEELLEATVLRAGRPLVSDDLTSDGRAVLQTYARGSYLDATASQNISRDNEAKTASIRYEIVEGDTASISEIRIVGLEKTRRYVVERELTVEPGDPFDPVRIGESQAAIYGSGLFNAVWMEPAPEDSGKDLRRLMVRVRERSSGYYDVRIGYATIDGLTVGGEIANRNVQGQGLRLSLNWTYSKIRRSIDGLATDPWFLGNRVTASLLAGYSWDDEVSYLGETTGGTVIFSREFRKTLTLDTGLEYKRTVVYESHDVEHEVGTNYTSSILVGGTHDTRDDILNAKRGMFARVRVDFATSLLGGTNDFMRPNLEWRGYRDIRGGRLGALLTRFAWIRPWEEMGGIPVNERFFAGGDGSVRGYPRNSLGPVDIAGTPTGGNALVELQGEIRFRGIGNWQLVVFVDAGQVYEELSTIDLSKLAVGAGPGIRYLTRIGAIRIDVAYPINNDGSWQFYFGIGQEF